jgi:hypothetical protein
VQVSVRLRSYRLWNSDLNSEYGRVPALRLISLPQ